MLSKRTLLEIQTLLIEAGLDDASFVRINPATEGLDPEIRSDDRRAQPSGFEVEFHCYGRDFLDKLMIKSANDVVMFQWTLHDYTNYIKEDSLNELLGQEPMKHFVSMQKIKLGV